MDFLDLPPFEFVAVVLCGYFLLVFIVLSFIPGASTHEIGKGE